MYEVQLIDWNLVSFYHHGYENSEKKGTICYIAPEVRLETHHLTPAADIFSAGIVMLLYLTGEQTYLGC